MKTFLILTVVLLFALPSCVPYVARRNADQRVPVSFRRLDSDSAILSDSLRIDDTVRFVPTRKVFYGDSVLTRLIDSVVNNNRSLLVAEFENEIARFEIDRRRGEYLPSVDASVGGGIRRASQRTLDGAVEESVHILEGHDNPRPLPDFSVGARVRWEVDIWGKLHAAAEAAEFRYESTQEATRLYRTQLVAETAGSFYELNALDEVIGAVDTNIAVLQRALRIIQQQKDAAKVSELAVQRFEAEVRSNEAHRYELLQRRRDVENRLNVLTGGYPEVISIHRPLGTPSIPDSLWDAAPRIVLECRPDVRSAYRNVLAAEKDVEVARAQFYPSFGVTAGFGLSAFSLTQIVSVPSALMGNIVGDLVTPLVNRASIEAMYRSACARHTQSVLDYEQTLREACAEIDGYRARIQFVDSAYSKTRQQVLALQRSVDIATNLFTSARADYMEVLLTQRDALLSRIELVETWVDAMRARIGFYKAIGGG